MIIFQYYYAPYTSFGAVCGLSCNRSSAYMLAKVTQQFEGFTKTDLITLVNDGGNWKVSQSINSYK
ncbi:hypothetical protein ABE545_22680 [Sphingobacterium faecium]|uniref:hypothetical protein n=1 Tax=Sphingobacterium TaxID=28453 RepID=UPI00143A0130|nr:hypothetical protein [Sphingobacterium sp. B16(2022)]NJI73290.1 hypothetical protein [Sphingobacterium sp. B16(2022)]